MYEKFVFRYQVSRKKQQFAITHITRQTDILKLLHS